jgi:hypothetical protein
MKKVLSGLTVLFTAALLIYSCNPGNEAQLPPPNNQTQVTVAEAYNLIQGAWYMKRVEDYNTYCIGDPKMISCVFNTNTSFTSYKYEFTGDNQVICQSGSFSNYFEILPFDFDETVAQNLNMVAGDICLNIDGCPFCWTPSVNMEAFGGEHMKIIELTSNKLTLENPAGRVYFERDLSMKQPVNSLGLSGTYVHDLYSDIVNGVVEYSGVPSPVKLTFTNEIFAPNASYIGDFGQYFKGIVDYSDCSFGYYEIFDDMSYFDTPVNDMSFFRYQVSTTHLFSFFSNMSERFKIHILNQNELVLRLHTSCNSYEEYHYTKVN